MTAVGYNKEGESGRLNGCSPRHSARMRHKNRSLAQGLCGGAVPSAPVTHNDLHGGHGSAVPRRTDPGAGFGEREGAEDAAQGRHRQRWGDGAPEGRGRYMGARLASTRAGRGACRASTSARHARSPWRQRGATPRCHKAGDAARHATPPPLPRSGGATWKGCLARGLTGLDGDVASRAARCFALAAQLHR